MSTQSGASMNTMKCYANACPLPPTMSLALRRHSGRWTSPELTYCTEHAAKVAESFQAHSMDTRLTNLEPDEPFALDEEFRPYFEPRPPTGEVTYVAPWYGAGGRCPICRSLPPYHVANCTWPPR